MKVNSGQKDRELANERRAFNDGMAKAKTENDVDAIGNRILAKLRSEKDRLAELEDGGKWGSSEWSIQAKFVSDYEDLYRQFKLYRESTIKRIQDQAAAEKRLAELAKEREKAEREAEQNRKKLRELEASWMKSESDRAYKKKKPPGTRGMAGPGSPRHGFRARHGRHHVPHCRIVPAGTYGCRDESN